MPAKPARAKAQANDFAAVFRDLRAILQPYEKQARVAADTPVFYSIETREPILRGKPMFFAAVRAGKAYVSFHLMPLYSNPDMRNRISPELRKRMQGKSCFNFTRSDPQGFAELARLTKEGWALYQKFAKFTPEDWKRMRERGCE